MHREVRPAKVLLYQSAGFLAVIAVCWVDEFAGLTQLIMGNIPFIANFRESTLKMLLILCVWLLVAGATRRVLAHLRYLESFMKVCAWCRRIQYKGQWMRLEEFLEQGFETPTSHGICAQCLEQRRAAIERELHSHDELREGEAHS
jgi:hypothetical protein